MTDLERRVDELLDRLEPAIDRAFWTVLLLVGVVFGGGVGLHIFA
jgi:hypothetical protein